MMLVEDSEILRALEVSGPGPGIELKVLRVRDKEAELLRGPEGGAVQMAFRATFDCVVVVGPHAALGQSWQTPTFSLHRPWVSRSQSVRLEWTVEASFDKDRGMTSVGAQVAPLRFLDPGPPLP
jgi:hypothetical protein